MSRTPDGREDGRGDAAGEVILEFVRHGPLVRVSAIDAGTLTEVVVQAPSSADPATLRDLALRKLDYVLRRVR